MAEPVVLVTAIQALRAGVDYLDRRKSSARSSIELDLIEDWHATLMQMVAHLSEPGLAVGNAAAPVELDSVRQRIQGFHEWSDIDEVDNTFGDLHDRLVMLAGPNGPGRGRPKKPKGLGG